ERMGKLIAEAREPEFFSRRAEQHDVVLQNGDADACQRAAYAFPLPLRERAARCERVRAAPPGEGIPGSTQFVIGDFSKRCQMPQQAALEPTLP
ncbi:MAG: hypothetical protein WBF58_01865, partial [Xanthobacteraceae bacterium]